MLKKQPRLAAECLSQIVVEVRKQPAIRRDGVEIAQVEPLLGEVRDERLRARICEHATDFAVQKFRLPEIPARCGIEQRVIRDAAPEEERQTRGKLEVADAIRRLRRQTVRIALGAEKKLATHEHRTERGLDAGVEISALLPRLAIEP